MNFWYWLKNIKMVQRVWWNGALTIVSSRSFWVWLPGKETSSCSWCWSTRSDEYNTLERKVSTSSFWHANIKLIHVSLRAVKHHSTTHRSFILFWNQPKTLANTFWWFTLSYRSIHPNLIFRFEPIRPNTPRLPRVQWLCMISQSDVTVVPRVKEVTSESLLADWKLDFAIKIIDRPLPTMNRVPRWHPSHLETACSYHYGSSTFTRHLSLTENGIPFLYFTS